MTGQIRSGQDRTGQYSTKQNETGQDGMGRDGQSGLGHVIPCQDRTGQDRFRSGHNRIRQVTKG